jgi:hypothetical protein
MHFYWLAQYIHHLNYTKLKVSWWNADLHLSMVTWWFPIGSEVWGHVTTNGQSVNMSWRRAHFGTCDQILILSEFRCVVFVGRPLWREVTSVSCQSLSAIIVHCQFCFLLFLLVCLFFSPILHVIYFMYIQYTQGLVGPDSVQQILLHHL